MNPTVTVACPLCGGQDARRVMQIDEIVLATRGVVDWPIQRCASCSTVYVGMRSRDVALSYHDSSYEFERSPDADAIVDGRPYAVRVLSELEELTEPGTLLDVGCATGRFLQAATEREWTATGVELAEHLADVAIQRGLTVHVGDLDAAGLAPDSFDAVTLLDVIEHLEDPKETLRQIHRILRPGGLLVVETPNWNSIYRRALGRWWAALQPRLHLLYFDSHTLGDALRDTGFSPVVTRTEIVGLLSKEGRLRGFGPSFFSHWARQIVVRRRVKQRHSKVDDLLLRIRGTASRDANTAHEQTITETRAVATVPEWLRRLNAPIDRFFLNREMGEQLRIIAKKV